VAIRPDRIDRFISKEGELVIIKSPEDVKREKEEQSKKEQQK